MKKLFLYVVLGLLLSSNAFALTEVDKYAYKKVYDDYYTCAVYFKFLSRGVERADNLSDKQKNFVNTMKFQSNTLDMDGRELVEFLNKETDSNITNEDIQKKVENIYVSFLDIAGRDYSKTQLLNDKYLTICNDLLDNSDSRFEYWKQDYFANLKFTDVEDSEGNLIVDSEGNSIPCVKNSSGKYVTDPEGNRLDEPIDLCIDTSELVGGECVTKICNTNEKYNEETCKCENVFKNIPSDDLKGKQLYCKRSAQHYGIQFKRNNNVKVFGAGDDDDWISVSGKYRTKPDTIFIDAKYKGDSKTLKINRKTLKESGGALCELFPSNINLEKKLKKIFNETMDKKKEDNKI